MALLIDILAAGVMDSSDVPLENGKAFIYEVGTTTQTDSYEESSLSTLHTNPIILDSVGRTEAYVSGDVRVLIKDASDVTVLDIDSIGVAAGSTGDFTIGNDPSDQLNLNASVNGNLIPFLDIIYNVGSASKRWLKGWFKDLDVSGGVNITGTSGHTVSAEFSDAVETSIDATNANNIRDKTTRELEVRTDSGTVDVTNIGVTGFASGTLTTSYAGVSFALTITTTGKPVFIYFIPGDVADPGVYVVGATAGNIFRQVYIRVIKDSVAITDDIKFEAELNQFESIRFPTSGLLIVDEPAAGSYTYQIQAKSASSATTGIVNGQFIVEEKM